MRLGLLAVIPVVLGTSLGTCLTWREYKGVINHFDVRSEQAVGSTTPTPRAAVVGDATFDFGTLGQQQTGEHTFAIRNDGTGLLELSLANISCGQCVETEFSQASVQAGQSANVTLKYHTRKPGPYFAERAELSTNDPSQELISLQIRGYVTRPARLSVEELVVGNVSSNEPSSSKFQVYAYQSDTIEVVGHELTNPQIAAFFELKSEPLDAARVAEEKHAKAGRLVTLTVKPGLPIGAINQTIRLEVQTLEKQAFELPIRGAVVSDISVVGGQNFSPDVNVLSFGSIKQSEGAKSTVRILVKGPYRKETKLSIGKTDPADVIRAELGEPSEMANGAIISQVLTITIPPGARVVNRLGTDQGKSGRVIIDTTHPTAKVVDVRVRFATE